MERIKLLMETAIHNHFPYIFTKLRREKIKSFHQWFFKRKRGCSNSFTAQSHYVVLVVMVIEKQIFALINFGLFKLFLPKTPRQKISEHWNIRTFWTISLTTISLDLEEIGIIQPSLSEILRFEVKKRREMFPVLSGTIETKSQWLFWNSPNPSH